MCGRINNKHYSQMVQNYIVPLIGTYGYCGGEVILEHAQELFGRRRFGAYVDFVKAELGFGYMSPMLHNLSHGYIITREAGGFRCVSYGGVVWRAAASLIPFFTFHVRHSQTPNWQLN